MRLYQVTFHKCFPGASYTDDNMMTAFVQAESFDHAVEKVKEKYKQEYESAKVYAVALADDKCEIIL